MARNTYATTSVACVLPQDTSPMAAIAQITKRIAGDSSLITVPGIPR